MGVIECIAVDEKIDVIEASIIRGLSAPDCEVKSSSHLVEVDEFRLHGDGIKVKLEREK